MKKIILIFFTLITLSLVGQTTNELEMVKLINQVRTNPKSFIPVVEAYIANLQDTNTFGKIKIAGATVTKKTNNITNALKPLIIEAQNLIIFLNNAKPVSPLETSKKLYSVSKKLVLFLDSTKHLGHMDANGESLNTRTKNIGYRLIGENATIGKTASDAMLALLIDFNVNTKAHRDNILNPEFTEVSSANSGNTWVQDFGGK